MLKPDTIFQFSPSILIPITPSPCTHICSLKFNISQKKCNQLNNKSYFQFLHCISIEWWMGLGHLVQTPIINILVQFLSTFFVLLQYQIHAVLFRTMHVSEQHRIQWQNPYQSLYWPFQEASSSLKTSFDILIFSVFKVASRLRESRLISWGLMHLFGEAKSSINLSKISSTS